MKIDLNDTIPMRRRRLRRHLIAHGPEHFDQGHWFSTMDESLEQFIGEDIHGEDIIGIPVVKIVTDFDINNCGNTACLAGHGALVMLADIPEPVEIISSHDVSRYFGLDEDWFSSDLDMDHPGHEVYLKFADVGLDKFGEWAAQVYALAALEDEDY